MSTFNYNLLVRRNMQEETTEELIEINDEDTLVQYLLDELFKYFFHPIEWDVVELFKARDYDALVDKFPFNDNEGRLALTKLFNNFKNNDYKAVIKGINSYLSSTQYKYITYQLIEKGQA